MKIRDLAFQKIVASISLIRVTEVNIAIMSIFPPIRQTLLENKDLALRVKKLECSDEKNRTDIRSLFGFIERFLAVEEKPKQQIGFHP